MKRTLSMMCMVAACCVAAVSAQTGMDKPKMDSKMKDGAIMVTGCVADKGTDGHYMLNNAMMSDPMMMDKSKMDMPKSDTGMAAGDHSMAMSYWLSGGDLKAHVGHKVEITGMTDKAEMDKMHKEMMDKDKMGADKMAGDKMAMDMKPMKLTVKSVKMISATCP
jgi:hypothetical protein